MLADSKRVCRLLACVLLAGVGGCASTGGWGEPDEAVVRRLAQDRWDALLAKDYERAYKHLSRGSRVGLPIELYKMGVPQGFWTGAKVGAVVCAEDKCDVTVVVEYRHAKMQNERPIPEHWVKEQGGWAYVAPSRN